MGSYAKRFRFDQPNHPAAFHPRLAYDVDPPRGRSSRKTRRSIGMRDGGGAATSPSTFRMGGRPRPRPGSGRYGDRTTSRSGLSPCKPKGRRFERYVTHVFNREGQVPHLAEKPARNRGRDGRGSLDGSAVVTYAAASGPAPFGPAY